MQETSGEFYFLARGGEMGQLIREKDWSQTSLGPPANWPSALKTMISMMLDNPFGMYIAWGSDYLQLYNDGYRPILGKSKHPHALGRSSKETFAEIWHIIGPMFNGVMEGKAIGFPDFMLPLNRNGYVEECYFNFSYSPIRTEDGSVGGLLVTVLETTTTKLAQESLKESEERFRTMAEGSDLLIAVSDETSNAVFFNSAWVTLTGRQMNELLAYGWLDLVHSEDQEKTKSGYLEAFLKKAPFTIEFRIKGKDAQFRWLLVTGTPRFTSDNHFAGYISSSVDITERKLSEKKHQEVEHKMRSIIENAPFPIGVYIGPEMRIDLANQSILNAWGKGNNVIGKSFMDILPELSSQDIFQQLKEVYNGGVPFHAKNQRVDLLIGQEIKPHYFNYAFIPMRDSNGHIYGVMNTAAEVTDIVLANLKVQESENNLRQTILQAPVAMCILKDSTFVVELANELMFELMGRSSSEILNKPLFEGLPEASQQGLEELLTGVFNTGNSFLAEAIPVTLPRNGTIETFYINLVYEAYREAGAAISGVIVVATDVTPQIIARQKIEEVVAARTKELADANLDLQKSNAELAQFAYIASHDLQEPLRKISNFTQMLENRIGHLADEQSRSFLQKINSSAARMHTLIRDVLSYSELVKETDAFEIVNLNTILNSVLVDYELLVQQKEAVVEADLLPEVHAIPLQMAQLFGNMVGNSLKFTRPDRRPHIQIRVSKPLAEILPLSLSNEKEYIQITFKDNGIGFKAEFEEKIFHIFQRLHRKSEYEGTGIGLALCKKIVQNHHGELNAIGSSENGAVFNVLLPVNSPKS